MKTKKQKGFTLVELVIVIAVIAILAAVLIPTFSNLVKKANVSKDTQLVRNLNTALASDVKEHKTMTEALEAAEENGYDVSKINASATDNEILWDSVNDVFCYLNGKDMEYIPNTKVNEVKDYEYWQICTSIPSEQKYSIYWNSEEDFTETLKVGFDAGKNTTITNLRYENNNAQTVTIRTNGGTLTINAPLDTVNHYGKAAEVFVEEINSASYHLFGKIDTLQIKKGHAVIENDAETTNVIVDSSESENSNAPSVDNKGTIKNVIGSKDKVTGNAPSKEITVTKTELDTNGGYVKLTVDQTISEDLTLTKDTILDLNGKTITFEVGKKLVIESNVTIMDLSSDQKGKIEYNYNGRLVEVKNGGELILNSGQICGEATQPHLSAFVRVYPNSTLIVNGGTISYKAAENFSEGTLNGEIYSINLATTVFVDGNNAKLYVNGGVIESDTAAAISGNNLCSETFIEINGGIVKSKEAIAIYHPQTGTFNINGGYIEGATAIYQKCGTMTITGGTFKATGVSNAYEYMVGGADPTGDCIVIDSCKGYGGITTASISLENSNIIVVDKNASKVMGYVYENEEAVIVWNGEKVKSIKIK